MRILSRIIFVAMLAMAVIIIPLGTASIIMAIELGLLFEALSGMLMLGRMLIGRAYIGGRESRQVKSAKFLTNGRNGFTEPRFLEQESECAEMWGIARFEAKSHGTGKSVGVTCEQDIIPAILSRFDDNRIFHDIAKRMRRRAYLLRCFMI